MIIPENINNIIFDYDGVLGDSSSFNKYACEQTALKLGINLTDGVYSHCAPGGATIHDIATCIVSHYGMPEKAAEFVQHKKSFDGEYAEKVKLYWGVPEIIKRLSTNYRLAVNTGTRHVLVDTVLQKHGVLHYFDFVIAAEDINKGKPDPESYLQACSRFGSHPSDCLVVEDGTSGISSAIAAGCIVVGLTTTHNKEDLLSLGCHFVIDALEELTVPTEA